ncbi:MAG: UDP-4-amino-4,6-dideoxy-N-acetyl-beta-L-altrosamine transaminase [Halobacteriovoraceae bacterium]|nr:UDP-4-amino-4,6-dideoxy-N-acetyl-beta-L-altrosamine transaminase [Halobacteriovoraceae bacterium]
MDIIPYGKHKIEQEDIEYLSDILRNKWLTQGPEIEKLENSFKKLTNAPYAVAVCNGTAALHLAALSIHLSKNDTVITTPISFVATANCARYCGADVDFCDIDPETYLMDFNRLEDKLKTTNISAVLPVDLGGLAHNLSELSFLANKYHFKIIEDSCHAIGARYQSEHKWFHSGSCSHSDLAVFSLHPVKHIAAGEGGIITCRDESIYKHLLRLRTHGIVYDKNFFVGKELHPWAYEMQELGYNYRISDINAGLAFSQMRRIDQNLKTRKKIAKIYRESLKDVGDLTFQKEIEGQENAYHLFILRTKRRDELYNFLREHHIYSQVHYIPIHTQPYYRGIKEISLPIAESYYKECLSLPMYHSLSDNELSFVIDRIREFFTN